MNSFSWVERRWTLPQEDEATQVPTRRKVFLWIVNSFKNWALTFQLLEGVD
jgi:hypothetical protein